MVVTSLNNDWSCRRQSEQARGQVCSLLFSHSLQYSICVLVMMHSRRTPHACMYWAFLWLCADMYLSGSVAKCLLRCRTERDGILSSSTNCPAVCSLSPQVAETPQKPGVVRARKTQKASDDDVRSVASVFSETAVTSCSGDYSRVSTRQESCRGPRASLHAASHTV